MIFGIDTLGLPAALMLVKLAACPAPQKIDVEVDLVVQESPYITNITSQWLTENFGNDPDGTLATDGKWMVGGLTKRDFKGQYNASFWTHVNQKTGETCLAVSTVKYTITYIPTVYIASDFKHLGCRHSATVAHEKRHVNTDRRTFNEYIPYMKKEIERYAESLPAQGPYPAAQVPAEQQRVLQQIAGSIKHLEMQLATELRKRQAAIDTVDNYMRDTAICPGQFPKFDGTQ